MTELEWAQRPVWLVSLFVCEMDALLLLEPGGTGVA